MIDGEWWAVPYHQRAGGGYYRKDAFEGAGIDIQTIRTYDKLREACLKYQQLDFYGWGLLSIVPATATVLFNGL
ncbi:MAG: hypothetical protein R2867_44045 [Caldilineaceae bacterium]